MESLRAYVEAGTGALDTGEGPVHRCAARLKDGTELPCVVLKPCAPRVDLAVQRFCEDIVTRAMDALDGQALAPFLTGEMQVAAYNIASVRPSPFAVPAALLEQIEGETFMGWTAFVFQMADGAMFNYGTAWHLMFLELPEGYGFGDVVRVHNNAVARADGSLVDVYADAERYHAICEEDGLRVFGPRIPFDCYYDAWS